MKKISSLLILTICIVGCSSKKKTIHFDETNKLISEIEFREKWNTGNYLISRDSSHHKKLVQRFKTGQIRDRGTLLKLLEQQTNQIIPRDEPLIIMFHHKRPTNLQKEWMSTFYPKVQKGVAQICDATTIYLYRDKKESPKKIGESIWYNDPQKVIDGLFIKNNNAAYYNFIIISENGEYICVLGEFPKEWVWNALKKLKKQMSSFSIEP